MTAPWDRPPEYFERGEDKPGELAAAVAYRVRQRREPATHRNMPATRYGVAPVRSIDVDDSGPELRTRDVTYWMTAIDLLGRGLDPRPLYSERRRMEQMSPARLGLHLILRRVYFALPDRVARTWLVRRLWRLR